MRKISGSSPKMTRKNNCHSRTTMLRCLRSKLGQESEIDYPVKPDNDIGSSWIMTRKLSFPCSDTGISNKEESL